MKARIEALEKVAEQSLLEAGAVKETAREVLRAVEEMDRKRTKEVLMEAKRRDEVERTIQYEKTSAWPSDIIPL